MSGSSNGKINPKNLLYDRSATLPPFLARLHAQHAPGNFDGPDPILAARRRPTGKKRSGSEEAEDAPLILDERGEVLEGVVVGGDGSLKEKVVKGTTSDGKDDGEQEGAGAGDEKAEGDKVKEEEKQQENNVGIGASKKRKVGKVIGGDDGESDQEQDEKAPRGKSVKEKGNGKTEEAEDKPKPKAAKKKAKKIKLSFGDEEG